MILTNESSFLFSRPFPLTTVQLQKLCAQKLKISSEETMNIAEKLYQSGFISYPRTETSKYGPGFDFKSLIALQKDDPSWGSVLNKVRSEFQQSDYIKQKFF